MSMKIVKTVMGVIKKMIDIKKCVYRAVKKTEACGGALYWFCLKKGCQVNVYDDCKDCEDD